MSRKSCYVIACCWIILICNVCMLSAKEYTQLGNKSRLFSSSSIIKVEKFQRELVFFNKKVDLPCLRIPEHNKLAQSFFIQVGAYRLAKDEPLSCNVIMTRNGELLFLSYNTIYRVTNENNSNILFKNAELNIVAQKTLPKNLRFESLLYASNTKDFIYLRLANASPKNNSKNTGLLHANLCYIGKLDLIGRKLWVVQTNTYFAEIDTDSGWIYDIHNGRVERKNFKGEVIEQWSLKEPSHSCKLAPDKQNLLSCRLDNTMSLMNLKTGVEANLPVHGRAAVWGDNNIIYYISEEEDNNILETSLMQYHIGEQKSKRLFMVKCERERLKDSLLGVAPQLSTDRSWLAWPLPVEDINESKTVLLDIIHGQYRLLDGCWNGVQW